MGYGSTMTDRPPRNGVTGILRMRVAAAETAAGDGAVQVRAGLRR
jgi:hypothetical protein